MTRIQPSEFLSMLKHITLHLARSPGFPSGSTAHGYDIVAPLSVDGHLDPKLWKDKRPLCRVRRFWEGEPEQFGRLVHRSGGAGGGSWRIDYDPHTDSDDETGYRLEAHTFRENEYVSIRDSQDKTHTFKVAAIRAA
jgi:hypothetical protein